MVLNFNLSKKEKNKLKSNLPIINNGSKVQIYSDHISLTNEDYLELRSIQ